MPIEGDAHWVPHVQTRIATHRKRIERCERALEGGPHTRMFRDLMRRQRREAFQQMLALQLQLFEAKGEFVQDIEGELLSAGGRR